MLMTARVASWLKIIWVWSANTINLFNVGSRSSYQRASIKFVANCVLTRWVARIRLARVSESSPR